MDTRKLYAMAVDCLRHHGLEQQGWKIEWDMRKKRLGSCSVMRRTITLSAPAGPLE